MHLLVGLGNPGKKYERNRHNIGFLAIDKIADKHGVFEFREKWSALQGKGRLFGDDAVLLKPQTFMNLSGDSVQPAAAFLKVAADHIVVVHDELDLPFGEVRLKFGGGHAGHNGLRSMIARLGTPDFLRVRVGIGRPPATFRGEVADYVLGDFDGVEQASLPDVYARIEAAVERLFVDGAKAAMTATNAKAPVRNGPKKEPKPPTPAG